MNNYQKIIFWLYGILFFLIPIILWPFTSEVFEFNKIVLLYILTTLIVTSWSAKMILEKKFIFRRTILDIPLLVFVGSQFISTIFSIDPLTSWLGYYSRFNGGFISTLSYSLLYWGFVSNFNSDTTKKIIKYFILPGAAIVSIYGVLEHFGIDKNIWVQDVQSRVFSTLGQPNWLAAWLVAIIPLSWALLVNSKLKIKNVNFLLPFVLSILFFWTMIFTKSRSGLLAFGASFVIFWIFYFWKNIHDWKKQLIPFVIVLLPLAVIAAISGTQYTPSIFSLVKPSAENQKEIVGPSLETGGTESGTIRKIVWKGAIDVWKNYPVFGRGVETFAFSYYQFRPTEHNLTSEWDFVYNKAHNEYLNFAANSGTIGVASYLALIGFSVFAFFGIIKKEKDYIIPLSLFAGYMGLLISNFFGFSVVPTSLQFFLFPALALGITFNEKNFSVSKKNSVSGNQKTLIIILIAFAVYSLHSIYRYWNADYQYSYGKSYNSVKKYDVAAKYLQKAIGLAPKQSLYYAEIANSYANIALLANNEKQTDTATQFSNLAVSNAQKAISLSPANVNAKRVSFGVYIMLSTINQNYFSEARDILIDAIKDAPTDAKLYYNLALTYARVGQIDLAISTLEKTIDLKANYKEARLAYAILLISKNKNQEARTQLEYILEKIDPNDSLTKQTLVGIK